MNNERRHTVVERVLETTGIPDRTRTESLCPVCLERLAAQRIQVGDEVHLVKTCPQHGTFQTPIWRGKPAFDQWQRPKIPVPAPVLFSGREKGCPYDCGLCPDHRQRSCTVIIEVTQRCDLACPVCYADASGQSPDPSPASVAELFRRAAQAGPGSNIQLSGGEPTLRDDLPVLVAMGRDAGFNFIQVNTNGLRLGRDRAFVKALKQAGLASVFLQFDGIEDGVYSRLRGRGLVEAKRAAVEACAEQGIGVVLVPTLVPGVNTHQIGAILQTALSWVPAVRGVHFQPVSYFGRYSMAPDETGRITLPEVMRAIEEQSQGRFKAAHLGPPGCENALCSFHGRFMQLPDGKLVPLTSSAGEPCCCAPEKADAGAARAIAAVASQWAGPARPVSEIMPADSCDCGIATKRPSGDPAETPMSLDAFIHRARTHTFSISAMAFQDAWTLALDRVRDCCIHVMAPDGRLIPFCLYNLTAADGRRLYRS
jgi:7,8-dihydro-6-hydroxymethylpterin dimethyltransferase